MSAPVQSKCKIGIKLDSKSEGFWISQLLEKNVFAFKVVSWARIRLASGLDNFASYTSKKGKFKEITVNE